MADKSIDQLNAAEKIYATDLFVLQQSGSAKKLTGQVLLNWLTAAADGHGGIQSIAKLSTSGLVDTYRITLADTTAFDFVVTNGRSITGISKTSTSGLVDTYTISYNNGTTSTFTVKNGEKGDKGDNSYIWIKYASQEPTESSHSMGDIPDDWIGIYSGNASTAPTDWKQYKWFQIKGEKGNPGEAATLMAKSVTYQAGDSGNIIPSGSWNSSIPVVPQGKYLWTKTELRFNTGEPVVSYVSARQGLDGSGSVASVNNVSPDETGNVTLTAADVAALPTTGGDVTGAIDMNGHPISGLNDPTEESHAANKGYVDASVRTAAPRNLLDNWYFLNPVNQRGVTTAAGSFFIDRWLGSGGTVTAGGISFTPSTGSSYIIQRLDDHLKNALDGQTVCASVLYADGTLSTGSGVYRKSPESAIAFINDGNVSFNVYRTSDASLGGMAITFKKDVTVQAVKLELGSVQTLARPVDSRYVLSQVPDYYEMLARCQRYFVKFPLLLTRPSYVDANILYFDIPIPVTMKTGVNPSIGGLDKLSVRSVTYATLEGFTFSASAKPGINYVRISANKANHGLSDAILRIDNGVTLSVNM